MSQPAAPQKTFASGRYSKRKRTQVNYRMEELDVDETDVESEEEIVKAKKQRRIAATRPLPKRKIFPFLRLPAEIRNMIYSYALVDPSGVKFVAVQRNKRRCVERVSNKTFSQVAGSRTYYQSNRINDDADEQATELSPSLLAVNKQIHREACDILYSNELIFADPIALYAFMINLGRDGSASRIKTMRLKGWGHGRTSKAYNNSCFAVLRDAKNLEKFYIDCTVGWYRQPKNAAQQIYRDAHPWLEDVGRVKGKFDAALDVLEVSAESLGRNYWNASQNQSDAQRRKAFNDELRRNLELQQKRVMVSMSGKKRKVSKVSGTT
ncbi:hypothetical protein E8E12_002825 [Didymella heteroderae]|uniref:DUF7730 domain-containing protein n=1 Tax=Didymella heteroderae TaxID=1769908 RepID=A0A9P5BW93_9PLEO|nr:hypothetical protein E8E12_002825 [Didymella heteroderae]